MNTYNHRRYKPRVSPLVNTTRKIVFLVLNIGFPIVFAITYLSLWSMFLNDFGVFLFLIITAAFWGAILNCMANVFHFIRRARL